MELFLLGTFWFWALIIAEIVMLFVFIANENGSGAFVSLLIFGACIHFMGDVDLFAMVKNDPLIAGVVILSYIILSIPWGVFRWVLFCRDRVEDYNNLKQEFLAKNGYADEKVVPSELRKKWIDYLSSLRNKSFADAPRVRDHKSMIVRSMSLWVVDLVWFVLGDMCVRIWKAIYNRIAKTLQKIADDIFSKANISEDLDIDEE